MKEMIEVSDLEKRVVAEGKAVFQTGAEIIHGPLGYLARDIRNVVSATDEAYKELYLYSLLKVAEFCQNMPITKDATLYSLIEHQMQQALSVLKVIRGSLFAKNSAQEDANKEEPKWIYAFFVYGLLYQLSNIQLDRSISVFNAQNELLGSYPFLFEHQLETKKYFSLSWEAGLTIDHAQFICMVENHFISPHALRWLAKNETLFVPWRNAFSKYSTENVFIQLTKKCLSKFKSQSSEDSASDNSLEDKKVVEDSASEINKTNEKNKEDGIENKLSAVVNPITPIVNPKSPLAYASQMLFEYLVFRADADSADCFRVSEGLFVSIKSLEQFIDTKNSRWSSVEEFINVSKRILINANDSYRFKYSPTAFEQDRAIEGIIIKEDCLNNIWKREPVNKDFKSETKL